jgi:drug/metabolite transporter (DMT)-like permease
MILGIIFGLGAATSQSFSYLCSRSYLSKHGSSFELLVVSHVLMGIFSLIILPFLPNEKMPAFSVYALPLFACAFSYFFGQFSFFMTIRHTEPSRVAPLLGLKIITVALFSVLFFNGSLTPLQWTAAAICLGGAMLSNWSGQSLSTTGIMWLLGTCAGYSLSDLYIRELIDALGREELITNSIVGTVYVYILCGVTTLPMIFFLPGKKWKKLKPALSFSLLWYGAMLLLFSCFAQIGAVYGNIVQSTRGIISIMLGVLIAHLGHVHLEAKVAPGLLARRVMAAILILAAIIIFSQG